MQRRLPEYLGRTLRGALTLNVLFFLRLVRYGPRDALARLAGAYAAMDGFTDRAGGQHPRQLLAAREAAGHGQSPAAQGAMNQSDTPAQLEALFERVLGRRPNDDEKLHWTTMLGGNLSLEDVEAALLASDEYEQHRLNRARRLIDLGRFRIFVMSSDTDVGAGLAATKEYEPHVSDALAKALTPGATFVDVGANIGYFSLLAASIVQKQGRVISFEPNLQNLRLLYASIVQNGFDQIQVFPVAAADRPKILRLQSFGSNGFLDACDSAQDNAHFIQAVPVDDLLSGVDRVDVIKMDIEGYEPLALQGMRRLLKAHKPVIFSEFNPWHIRHRCGLEPRDYLTSLTELGYQISVLASHGGVTPPGDADSVMRLVRDEKVHLDIVARPV